MVGGREIVGEGRRREIERMRMEERERGGWRKKERGDMIEREVGRGEGICTSMTMFTVSLFCAIYNL